MANLSDDRLDIELIALVTLSGIVALIGLFLNNIPIIIGAMVISPLVEPIYLSAIFLANGNLFKFYRHMGILFILLAILVFTSALITFIASRAIALPLTSEILSRTDINVVYTLLAIILGITTVIARRRGFITNVIGVGIAIALIPPAVVTGIAIIIYPNGVAGAFTLMLNNVFGLFIGMMLAFLIPGSRKMN